MQQFRYILPILAAVALNGCQSNRQVEDRLAAAFDETMFGADGEGHSQGEMFSKGGYLAKWKSPVRVAVMEGGAAPNVRALEKTLADLSAASGLEFEMVDSTSSDVALEIRFSDEREFIINGNQRAACYTRVGNAENGVIDDASVFIGRVAPGEWRMDCLTHELLHALGWRGHTHRIRSAISYVHGETELTKWDRIMMRTLYDPRLPPGISKEDAIPRVRVILREMIEK